MALELSSAGITLSYQISQTQTTTHPSAGTWTDLKGIKSIPDLNQEPDQLEVTDLSDTVYKRYIQGLRDTGGSLAFGANFTKAFATAWNTLVTSSKGKQAWFKISVPNFGDFYFAGEPQAMGLPSVEVNSVFEGDVYITANLVEGWTISA